MGGHDRLTSAVTCTVKFLAELPEIYDQVYKGYIIWPTSIQICIEKNDGVRIDDGFQIFSK